MEVGATMCPNCGAALIAESGFVTWCSQCEWGLVGPKPPEPRTRVERAYAEVGKRMGARLHAQLAAKTALEPRMTPGKVVAYAIAVGVYLLTIALALGGLWLGIASFPSPLGLLVAVALIGCAWFMRPRLGKLPKHDVVDATQAPELHRLVAEVAGALDTAKPDVIVVDDDYNASWSRRGLRRRRILKLGLPLFDVLDRQQRVALIGHELAHGRNGDARRGLIVGGALNSLSQLVYLLSPSRVHRGNAWVTLAEPLANAVLWIFRKPVWLLLLLEVHLLWQDSQRAEYLADALAARAAGSAAVTGLHERLLAQTTVQTVYQRSIHHRGDSPYDLFAELRAAFERVPPLERERRRRLARMEGARLNATHPPTGQRIALLEARVEQTAAVVPSAGQNAEIDKELARLRPALAARIVDRQHASLYW